MDKRIIAFDCMETVIDMTQLPTRTGYAEWTFQGSGFEHLWDSFSHFNDDYERSKESHDSVDRLIEQDKFLRILEVVRMNGRIEDGHEEIAMALFNSFWEKYLSRCYASEEVIESLRRIKSRGYRTAIVSNFTVRNGIHEILRKCGVIEYFDRIYSSADLGIRKPHPGIFQRMVDDFGTVPGNVVFFGDDYFADYRGGFEFGFQSYLYDRGNNFPYIRNRFERFGDFERMLRG